MNLKMKAITGAVWKLSERLFTQCISLAVTVILARLLTPEDYGMVAVVTIFFTFANILITGGLNTALIQKVNADEEDYSTVFTLSLIVSVLLYLGLFWTAPAIAELYQEPDLILLIRVMGLSLPLYAVKSIVCAYTSASLQFRKFFFATLGGSVFSAVAGITMALKGFGPWALVGQQLSNTLVDTVILYGVTHLRIRLYVSLDRFRSLFSFGWRLLVTSILGTIYNQICPLVIGLKFTPADLSFYEKGNGFPSMISDSITSTLSSVLFPVLARVQDDKEKLLEGTRLFIRTVSYMIFPAMLGFFAIADTFVGFLLTDKWLPAAYYIRIFCISGMFNVIAIGNCETIKAMGRSDIYLKIEVLKKTLYFVTLFLFVLVARTPETLSWSALVITGIAIVVNMAPNIKLIGYTLPMQLADLLPNLLTAAAMCAVVMLADNLELDIGLKLLVQILTGGVSYLLLSLVTRNQNLTYCIHSVLELLGQNKA